MAVNYDSRPQKDFMDIFVIITIVLILTGAMIMVLNIFKSISTLKVYFQVVEKDTNKVERVFRVHEILMVFFLIGYIVVAYATMSRIELVSDLFVGIIFFFGAVFVQLGIILQKKMIESIKIQYDNAINLQAILQEEKKNLSDEIKYRKKAQEEQKTLEKKLIRSEKMEALGLLAGGVAHDLNNVLSGIVSYPDLILMDLEENSPLRKPILTMQSSGKKAAEIVHDLLALARRGVIDKSIININDIILKYLSSTECEKLKTFHPNVSIKTDFHEQLPNVQGSFIQLKKVIMNLVSNAAEAQPTGGEITITTENLYVDSSIKGFQEIGKGDYVVIKVKDHGTGISDEDLPNIFEPFYTKKKMGRSGSGLGMSIVFGTIYDHNGYIDIKSSEGYGTSFLLYLPANYESKVTNKQPVPIEDYMGNRETVLVVDDIKEQRYIAENILNKLNYTTATVASGESACEYLKNNSVDLIILDMIIENGIDGLDTYKELIKINPSQKAIIASGYSETERVKEAQRLGAGEYLKKPYSLEKIGLAVKNSLNNYTLLN